MESLSVSDGAHIPIIVYVSIADENTLATFEAALRDSLYNVDIVKFKDGQSLIGEL